MVEIPEWYFRLLVILVPAMFIIPVAIGRERWRRFGSWLISLPFIKQIHAKVTSNPPIFGERSPMKGAT
jgi:hypothetical protein